MLAIALVITITVLFSVSIFSVIRISSLTSRNDSLKEELVDVKQQLANIDPSRPAYLRDFTPNKVIALDSGYVTNIAFTVQHQNGGTQYDYRLTVENKSVSSSRQFPNIKCSS